jgi:hypothetical protein
MTGDAGAGGVARADTTLTIALEAAVPLWIMQVAGLTADERAARGRAAAQIVASHGDDILFRGARSGDSAAAFNALAQGLALGAFQPGGITFAGHHWCTDHRACEEAQAATQDVDRAPDRIAASG